MLVKYLSGAISTYGSGKLCTMTNSKVWGLWLGAKIRAMHPGLAQHRGCPWCLYGLIPEGKYISATI